MQYSGNIAVCLRGRAGDMTDLCDALQQWVAECPREYKITRDVQDDLKDVQQKLRRIETACREKPADEIVCETWTYFSQIALVVLDFIDGLTHLRPQPEVVVAADINFSITDDEMQYLYYSAPNARGIRYGGDIEPYDPEAGWNVYRLQDFLDEEAGVYDGVRVWMTAKDVQGITRTFDFVEASREIPAEQAGKWDLTGVCKEDAAQLFREDKKELIFRMAADGTWRRVAADFDLYGYRAKDDFAALRDKMKVMEKTFDGKYTLSQFLKFQKSKPYPESFGARVLEILLPQTEISVQRDAAGNLHYLDQAQNEYFFGQKLKCKISRRLKWELSKEILDRLPLD